MVKRVGPLPLAAAAVVGVLVVFAYGISSNSGTATTPIPSKFSANGRTFAITYAATDNAQRQEGLMNRKITNSTIMLFVFPSMGYFQFWMYDTNTSLDILWVDTNGNLGHVVYLVSSAQPCFSSSTCVTYRPTAEANYVLEAKAGFASINKIEVGTVIQFS